MLIRKKYYIAYWDNPRKLVINILPTNGSGNTISFSIVNARYLRCWQKGSTVSAADYWVQIEAWGR